MIIRAALVFAVALLSSCSPPSEKRAEKSGPEYPQTLSLIEVINQNAKASDPDPMAVLLSNNRDILRLLEKNNYPVTLLWIKSEDFKKYFQERRLDFNELKNNSNLTYFLKSHIYKGDIPELANNSPIDTTKLYESYSGLVWSMGVTSINESALTKKTVNGVKVDGCYFVERGPTEEDAKILGRICYINAPIIDLIR